MLACAACTRSLPAEQFVKAQVKKGPQRMRCKACVTAEAPLPLAVVPEAEAVSVAAPSDVDRSVSQSVSHYHTPSREHMAHTTTLLTRVRVRRVSLDQSEDRVDGDIIYLLRFYPDSCE